MNLNLLLQLGRASQVVHGIAACGPSYRRRVIASDSPSALCAFAAGDLLQAARRQRKPLIEADLPQLRHAALAVAALVAAAAEDGKSASAGLLGSGAVDFLVQVTNLFYLRAACDAPSSVQRVFCCGHQEKIQRRKPGGAADSVKFSVRPCRCARQQ